MQRAIKDALKNVPLAEKILQEASAAVAFFHRSLYWNEQLQKSSGGLTLLSPVPTRWNSALIMLQRLTKEVWRAVSDTLLTAKTCKVTKSSKIPRLTVQRTQILELVSLLEPFEEATRALQGDDVTLSRHC
jgi:hypothetical protein